MTFPILPSNAPATGYNLTRSLRFRNSATARLSRSPLSAGNTLKYTFSGCVKRGELVNFQGIIGGGATSPAFDGLRFDQTTNKLVFFQSGGNTTILTSDAVFRDPSAWYHIVFAYDSAQATASNRVKIYVNNVLQTLTGTYPTLNLASYINTAFPQSIGAIAASGSFINYYDGYMAEVNFIDGQALTPSSFGSTNALTGVWQPARYTGTYGTNGFYLPFTDNSALTTSSNVGLGRDYSGNGNFWVTTNISITAGVTYDSMTDVPTLTNATTANYAVLNPLAQTSGLSLTNGNLTSTGGNQGTVATIIPTSGKWYWEVTLLDPYVAAANYFGEFGVCNGAVANYSVSLYGAGVRAYNTGGAGGGGTYINNTQITSSGTWAVNDVVGLAFDVTNLTLDCYRNNVKIGTTLSVPAGYIYPTSYQNGTADTSSSATNFGQRPFTYTPPTGFVALNAFNLPASTIVKGNTVMDATLYTGTGASLSVTNAASFQPDLVWMKGRSGATDHALYDSVRGVQKQLESNNTGAETTETTGLTAFGSGGFTVGALAQVNTSAATYVGWQWKAGGAAVSNTAGTITSQVSANASAGFSVVTYTGTGANATVGHGLGVAPKFIICKARSATGAWQVYHASLTGTTGIFLNLADASFASSVYWNNTNPTSSVFSIGTSSFVNVASQTQVAYCWSEIDGFSKLGSYTGNGSTDGPFVYLGFRPKFVMIKCTSSAATNWLINDTSRAPYNVDQIILNPNDSGAEINNSSYSIDELSNGFKIRTSFGQSNASGSNYIFAAFAENPFKNSLAR
jgi:hypothetical protein